MQIVPKYAGHEVREHLGEKYDINDEFLYNPENNIKYGINYLSLLSNKYFSHINPFLKRAPFIIAGYNWGPTRLLKYFNKGRFKLKDTESIISEIREVAPDETKDYLVKVFSKWRKIEDEKWI
jgi:membrane-bound lytic murein transglycosylase C